MVRPPSAPGAGAPHRPTAPFIIPPQRTTTGVGGAPAVPAVPAPVPPPAAAPPASPPPQVRVPEPRPTVELPVERKVAPTASAQDAAAASPPATPTASPGAASPRRPINPFLASDPGLKAKRLARALVSDMIAYLPQKREEGLKAGTLKQLFREEIKKSYEEYVDQIGKELAESTPHFKDALNDILADGRKIF